jgi:hypothetical protein
MIPGQLLKFKIYDTIVKGIFIRQDGDHIITTIIDDFIKENIGKEQYIHINFLVKEPQ